jgi:2-polyprenyl-3-methyl-5-hydroxy-6-metoxy-1,4-benzoquinol methylase
MSITNIYDSYTINSPSFIKRFAHRVRYGNSLKLSIYKGNSLLDFGTGSGILLGKIAELRPDTILYGYDNSFDFVKLAIENNKKFKNVSIIGDLNEIPDITFDNVSCFEVLEHLDLNTQIEAIRQMKSKLKKDGRIILSIPIETGVASLFKNVTRSIIGAPHTRKFSYILKATFGLQIKRNFKNGWAGSHVGFRFKDLKKNLLAEGLVIEKTIYSPFKLLNNLCNSQQFVILKRKEDLISD